MIYSDEMRAIRAQVEKEANEEFILVQDEQGWHVRRKGNHFHLFTCGHDEGPEAKSIAEYDRSICVNIMVETLIKERMRVLALRRALRIALIEY